jgi:hypothetical protein
LLDTPGGGAYGREVNRLARRGLALTALTLAGLVPGRPASTCDSTSCLLVTRGQSGLLPAKAWRVDFSFRQTEMTDRMHGGEDTLQVLRPKIDFEHHVLRPGYHDELGGRDAFLQLDVGYGLGAKTAVLASIPILAHRNFDIGHGATPFESYATSGNGDLLLAVRHAFLAGSSGNLVAGVGLEAPVGRYKLESPATRVDQGILDPTLQPGSGSFDFVASVQYAYHVAPARLDLTTSASYQRNGTNGLDYHTGDDAILSLTLGRPLAGPVSGTLQLKWARQARGTYLDEEVPGTGDRVTYLTPGLATRMGTGASLYGFVAIPIQRYVNEEQLAPRWGFVLGVSRTF